MTSFVPGGYFHPREFCYRTYELTHTVLVHLPIRKKRVSEGVDFNGVVFLSPGMRSDNDGITALDGKHGVMGVTTGLVQGVATPMTPIGLATSAIPVSLSYSRIPVDFLPLRIPGPVRKTVSRKKPCVMRLFQNRTRLAHSQLVLEQTYMIP
jgi:hypothetical protein